MRLEATDCSSLCQTAGLLLSHSHMPQNGGHSQICYGAAAIKVSEAKHMAHAEHMVSAEQEIYTKQTEELHHHRTVAAV